MWKLTSESANKASPHNSPEGMEGGRTFKIIRTNLSTTLLYIALIAGSIGIFSNSITSHNAGLLICAS